MNDVTPKPASRRRAFAALESLRLKLDSGAVTYQQVIEYLEAECGAPVHRANVGRWFAADDSERVEPALGLGLMLMRFDEMTSKKATAKRAKSNT
jgi:hypothetical protein